MGDILDFASAVLSASDGELCFNLNLKQCMEEAQLWPNYKKKKSLTKADGRPYWFYGLYRADSGPIYFILSIDL